MAKKLTDGELRTWEARRNVASIDKVPRRVLPDGPIRAHLAQLASEGRDVYAYHAGPADAGVWNLWLETARVPVADYLAAQESKALLAEAHLTVEVRP